MRAFFSSLRQFISNTLASLRMMIKAAPKSTFFLVIVMVVAAAIPFAVSKILAVIIDTLIGAVHSGESNASLIIFYSILWAVVDGMQSIVGSFDHLVNAYHRYSAKIYTEYLVLQKYTEIDPARFEQKEFNDLEQRAFGQRGYWPLQELGTTFLKGFTQSAAEIAIAASIIGLFDWRIFLLIIVTALPKFIVE